MAQTREDRARELRERALAMMAEADQAEQEQDDGTSLPPTLAAEVRKLDPPEVEYPVDPLYELLARLDGYPPDDQAVIAWQLVEETWEDFSGEQSLALVSRLLDVLFPQPVDDDVDEHGDNSPPSDAEIAAHVRGERFDPRVQALLGGQAYGEVGAGGGGQVYVTNGQPPAGEPPAIAARLAPRTDERPPRGMKHRPPQAQAAPAAQPGFTGPLSRGDDPRLAAARAQAMRATPTIAPRKAGAPRRRSEHNIPEHLQQWKRDGAGRRIPLNTPPDPE